MSPVSPCDLPIFDGQNARALLEQLRKAAGGGVADHLGDLSHGEIGVDEQVLRLAHPPPLNVLCDAAPKLPLEAAFQLRLAHAGDAGQAFQWNIEGIVVSDIADHILHTLPVLLRQRTLPSLVLPFPRVHHQRDDLRDLGFIEKRRCRAFAPIVLDLEQQLGHGGEIRGLVHALKRGGKIEVHVRILFFQVLLIVGRQYLNAHRVNGDALVDQRPVARLSAHDCLNVPGREPPIGVQLLAGDGVITLDADALRDLHVQTQVLMKEKVVDLDIEQVLLCIDPVIAAADRGRYLPASPCRAELLRTRNGQEIVLLQKRTVVIR